MLYLTTDLDTECTRMSTINDLLHEVNSTRIFDMNRDMKKDKSANKNTGNAVHILILWFDLTTYGTDLCDAAGDGWGNRSCDFSPP